MNIDEYMEKVIELFKSEKATDEQWKAMAQSVLNESESERTTTDCIDKIIDPEYCSFDTEP